MSEPATIGDATLYQGDCLKVMAGLGAGSVDLCLTDPPYGTTACKWDSVIPFEPMWAGIKRVVKPNAAITLFGSQPFTSALVMSNLKMFKYCWVWDKVKPSGFQIAKHRPMLRFEDVAVFCKGKHKYNPIMTPREKVKKSRPYSGSDSSPLKYNDGKDRTYTEKHPTNVIIVSNANQQNRLHPTQKPVALLEYLIRTYTDSGDVVLDFTMGSGSTGVAAANTGRRFIGIEIDPHYFAIACKRIEHTQHQNHLGLEAVA